MCFGVIHPVLSEIKAVDGGDNIPSIIPKPLSYEATGGSFTLDKDVKIQVAGKDAKQTEELYS